RLPAPRQLHPFPTRRSTDLKEDTDPQPLADARINVTPARNRLRSGLPLWGIAGLFAAAMVGIYSLYNTALEERIRGVLSVLEQLDRKSTRLNSSHVSISYAV